jgi:hypothetical protein
MSSPVFKTVTGRLTRYSFACGYVEENIVDEDNRVTLELISGNFHIKGFKNGHNVWETFEDASIKDVRWELDNYFTQGDLQQIVNSPFYSQCMF